MVFVAAGRSDDRRVPDKMKEVTIQLLQCDTLCSNNKTTSSLKNGTQHTTTTSSSDLVISEPKHSLAPSISEGNELSSRGLIPLLSRNLGRRVLEPSTGTNHRWLSFVGTHLVDVIEQRLFHLEVHVSSPTSNNEKTYVVPRLCKEARWRLSW